MASSYVVTLSGEQETPTSTKKPGSDCEALVGTGMGMVSSLLGLPPEIRLMIWELLLPGRRILSIRTRHQDVRQKTHLAFNGLPSQPVLSQICRESRHFILRRGAFAFKNGNDGGFWWSPEGDVLLIDQNCHLASLSKTLEDLDGLDMIRNIALDVYQAVALQWYKQEPRGDKKGMVSDSEGAYTVRWLLGWGKAWDCPCIGPGLDWIPHPIPRFFPRISKLTVHFAQPFYDTVHSGPSCDLLGDCSLTLEIPAKDMETAIHSFEELHTKWTGLPGGSDPNAFLFSFRWKPRTFSQSETIPKNLVEFYRKPAFKDGEDYTTKEWAFPYRPYWRLWNYRNRNQNRIRIRIRHQSRSQNRS